MFARTANKMYGLYPLARNNYRFFKTLSYVDGAQLTPHYMKTHQAVIESSKSHLKNYVDSHNPKHTDLNHFIDVLFNYHQTSQLIQEVDAQAKTALTQAQEPALAEAYTKARNNTQTLNDFLKNRYLPTLRKVFQNLTQHYGFATPLVETNDGLILDEDYLDFVRRGQLILDLGERSHGPLPHITAAFMMKVLEKQGQISSARNLYQSLAEESHYYCPTRMCYASRFHLLLDFPTAYPLLATAFAHPSSLSNHLLTTGDTLKTFARVCINEADTLAKISHAEWEASPHKILLTKGKTLTLDESQSQNTLTLVPQRKY